HRLPRAVTRGSQGRRPNRPRQGGRRRRPFRRSWPGRTVRRCSSDLKPSRARRLLSAVTPRSERTRTAAPAGRSAALANAGGLTAQVAQVVELGTADPAAGGDLDLLEHRAVHREGPLHSDGVADLADGEGLADSRPLPPDHHALEDLDTGPVALGDPNVDVQRVARTEVRHVGAQLGLLKLLNGGVHLSGSSSTARRADGLRSRGRICWVEYVVP